MPQPLDENKIFNTAASPYKPSINEKESDRIQKMLANKFPELVSARGTVDPLDATMTLLAKIESLETKVAELEDK